MLTGRLDLGELLLETGQWILMDGQQTELDLQFYSPAN